MKAGLASNDIDISTRRVHLLKIHNRINAETRDAILKHADHADDNASAAEAHTEVAITMERMRSASFLGEC